MRVCASVSTGSWAFCSLEDAATAAIRQRRRRDQPPGHGGPARTGRRPASARAVAGVRPRDRPGSRANATWHLSRPDVEDNVAGSTRRKLVPSRAAPTITPTPARDTVTQARAAAAIEEVPIQQANGDGSARGIAADADAGSVTTGRERGGRARRLPQPATAIDAVAPSRPRISRTSPTTCPIPTPSGTSGSPRHARARESPAARRRPSGLPTIDEPPTVTKGSGMPVTGAIPIVMPTLTKTWNGMRTRSPRPRRRRTGLRRR